MIHLFTIRPVKTKKIYIYRVGKDAENGHSSYVRIIIIHLETALAISAKIKYTLW